MTRPRTELKIRCFPAGKKETTQRWRCGEGLQFITFGRDAPVLEIKGVTFLVHCHYLQVHTDQCGSSSSMV